MDDLQGLVNIIVSPRQIPWISDHKEVAGSALRVVNR